MSASDNKNLDILLAANADVLTDQDAEYLRQLDVSDVEIPAETDKRITRMIKRKSWMEALHTPMLICKRIVTAFLIVCTIGFAVCMSIQEVRAYVINMIFEWSEKFVTVHYVPETTPPSSETVSPLKSDALQIIIIVGISIITISIVYFLFRPQKNETHEQNDFLTDDET